MWSTMVKQSTSGREFRAGYYSFPIWKFVLSYEFLRSATAFSELQSLIGFFNSRGGSFDSFLFTDPDDSSVTDQAIGTGDGVTTQFQLVRTFGAFVEPIYNINGTPTIKINGATQSGNYTINSSGLVTFNAGQQPIPGAVVAWTGNFYYRTRFAQDSTEYTKFMRNLWEARKIELVSVKE